MVDLPRAKDRDGWWTYINGDLKQGSLPFRPPGSTDDEEDEPSAEETKLNQEEIDIDIDIDDVVDGSDDDEAGQESDDDHMSEDFGVTVQKTGLIEDQPTNGLTNGVAGNSKDTGSSDERSSVASHRSTVPSPGYSPRPPAASIIGQLENVSFLLTNGCSLDMHPNERFSENDSPLTHVLQPLDQHSTGRERVPPQWHRWSTRALRQRLPMAILPPHPTRSRAH